MSFQKDLRQLLKPYYCVNILLSLTYVVCKRTSLICNFLFPDSDCELDARETEILFFLLIVVMVRTRKAGSVTMVNYLSSSFVYTKIANMILWLYADIRYGLPFGAILILISLLLPEPSYSGPEYVVYFRGPETLDQELSHNAGTTWLVCLYAAWHPACVTFAPVFAELSASYSLDNFKFGKLDVGRDLVDKLSHNAGTTWLVCLYAAWHAVCVTFAPVFAELSASYSLDNLKFGKLDVGRYPEAAKKFRIHDGPTSRQLPTVLLMVDGQEKMRRPQPDSNSKLQKFLFSKDNTKATFDLDGIYQECKKKLAAKPGKKTQ